jgi:hypothetical protein
MGQELNNTSSICLQAISLVWTNIWEKVDGQTNCRIAGCGGGRDGAERRTGKRGTGASGKLR